MEVVRDGDGRRVVEPLEVRDDAREGLERLGRLEVADVLGDEDLAPDRERDGGLHVRADAENHGEIRAHVHGQGRPAARAAQEARRPRHEARDAVVDVARDRPVVHEEEVGHLRRGA